MSWLKKLWANETSKGILIGVIISLIVSIGMEIYYSDKEKKIEIKKYENLKSALQVEMSLNNLELALIEERLVVNIRTGNVDIKPELSTNYLDFIVQEFTKYNTPKDLLMKALAYRKSIYSLTREWEFFYQNKDSIDNEEKSLFLNTQLTKIRRDLPFMQEEARKLLREE